MIESNQLSFSIKDFIAHTGLGRSIVYKCLADGRLRAVKVGKRVIIPADVARDFIASAEPATFTPPPKKAGEG